MDDQTTDDQRTDGVGSDSPERHTRGRAFSLRFLFLLVSLFAALFTVIGWRLKIRDYDVDARYMNLQGRMLFLESLKKSYDEGHVDKRDRIYDDVVSETADITKQLDSLKWLTKPTPKR